MTDNVIRFPGGRPPAPEDEDRIARRMLRVAKKVTPRGCQKPWETKSAIASMRELIDTIGAVEVEQHIRGCAAVIDAGLDDPQFWSIPNLFHPNCVDKWRNKIAKLEAKRAEEEALERRAQAQREQEEREAAKAKAKADQPPEVTDPVLSAFWHKLRKQSGSEADPQLSLFEDG